MPVQRWVFTDPDTAETYTVPMNPRAMTSPWPQRTLSSRGTTAVDGQAHVSEGRPTLAQWSFEGAILDQAHHDALKGWVYDHGVVEITDHFGRTIECVLSNFDVKPKRRLNHPWSHEFIISGVVLSVA